MEIDLIKLDENAKEMYDEIHKEVLRAGDIVNFDGRLFILEDE